MSNQDDGRVEDEVPKGTILKIFGIILIFLGTLDLMLFWRGGLPTTFFHLLLLIIGAVLFTVGFMRGRYKKSSESVS